MINIAEALKNLLSPGKAEAYLTNELLNTNTGALAVNLVIIYAVTSIAMFIGMAAALSIGPVPGGPATLLDIIVRVIGSIVIGLILMVVAGGILHLLAKAFGGRGSFLELLYLNSVVSVAFLLITFPFGILLQALVRIPLVNCVVMLLYLPLLVYLIYLSYLVVKVVYRLDSRKAAYVMVTYMAISFILGIAITVAYLFVYLNSYLTGGSLLKPV